MAWSDKVDETTSHLMITEYVTSLEQYETIPLDASGMKFGMTFTTWIFLDQTRYTLYHEGSGVLYGVKLYFQPSKDIMLISILYNTTIESIGNDSWVVVYCGSIKLHRAVYP